jgi:vacuolar-type H+-ATPase subunit F/Vma7
LCGPAAAAGFRLAGLEVTEAADAGEGRERLTRVLGDEEVGVLLVQEDYHAALPEGVRRTLTQRALPLVVPFAAPRWQAPEDEATAFVAELLRQAIGYRVRLG